MATPSSHNDDQSTLLSALDQALWGDDLDESLDTLDADACDELLALPELVGSELLSATTVPTTPPAFVPLQATALPNRRNLARRSRSKLFRGQPNRARDGRREELVYLSQKVAELEAQLADLQQKSGRRAGGSGSSTALVARTPPPSRGVAAIVWQAIAGRQSAQRVQAERENIRLRLVLEHQLKTAKSLEGILHRKLGTKVGMRIGIYV